MSEPMSDPAGDMRRDFADRAELITYLKEQFPEAAAIDSHVADTPGGRAAAEARLTAYDPDGYSKTRNYLNGNVSYLSPYLRYGVLSLAEVRAAMLARVDKRHKVEKFITELGWRDYYQRVYAKLGDGIWQDREPYKTGFDAADYADELPDDIRQGTTECSAINAFCRQLFESGYLHNHARMYVAAYVVHWRRVKWQAGAAWFLEHLLDGDPASNNLSWQWVASTFSHKPYFFNRDNLDRYSAGTIDHDCPPGDCPFDGSYTELEQRLFSRKANT